jgi:hypothetical protein
VEALEERWVPTGGTVDFAVGADAGGRPEVRVYTAQGASLIGDFFAFDPGFTGGVRVALADVNGDGTPDIIVAAGPGGGPEIKVIDGTKLNQVQSDGQIAGSALLADFFAFAPVFGGGVYVGAGDMNGDGHAEVITGAGAGGGPEVKVIDGTKLTRLQANGQISNPALLADFFAYNPVFAGGVTVAVGDVNGDGRRDLIAGAGPGGGPEVKVIDGTKLTQVQAGGQIASAALLADFFAFAPGPTRHRFSRIPSPCRISSRKPGSSAAAKRLRAMLSLDG